MVLLEDIPNIDFSPAKPLYELIEIIDLSELSKRKISLDHDPEKPHRIQFNLIVFVREGSGSHFVDFSVRKFHSGSTIFIRQNQIHAFDLSNSPQGAAIVFTDAFFQRVLSHIASPLFGSMTQHNGHSPILNLSSSLQQSYENLVVEIAKELDQANSSSAILVHLFSSLLLLLDRAKDPDSQFKTDQDRRKQLKVTEFLGLVEKGFATTRNATDYAQKLNMSYKTLNQFCKSVTRQTAKQLIDKYTILEAKRRLVLEDKPIQQLSFELGFDEETNFVKYFKKHTLVTPKKFRHSH